MEDKNLQLKKVLEELYSMEMEYILDPNDPELKVLEELYSMEMCHSNASNFDGSSF